MPRPTSLLVTAALGLVGLLAAARPAVAADWSAAPAANRFGDGRQDFRYTLDPGTSTPDTVVVSNHGDAPLDVALRAPGWVEIQRAVTVAPGETADVAFRVVLGDDARPGDRGGTIAGVPVRLRVGGPLTPRVAVEDVRLRDERVTYVLRNTGNATLSARQRVKVSGPFGRFEAQAGSVGDASDLLPGERREVSAPVRDVTPVIRLTATVTVLPLLTDEAGSTAPLAQVQATAHTLAVPWVELLVVLALCALAAAVTRWRRLRRSAAGRPS